MDNKSSGATSGIGFCGLLFLVFLVLKLCNVITWSWWWVTAPLWMPSALVVAIFIVAMLVILIKIGIVALIDNRRNKRRNKRGG